MGPKAILGSTEVKEIDGNSCSAGANHIRPFYIGCGLLGGPQLPARVCHFPLLLTPSRQPEIAQKHGPRSTSGPGVRWKGHLRWPLRKVHLNASLRGRSPTTDPSGEQVPGAPERLPGFNGKMETGDPSLAPSEPPTSKSGCQVQTNLYDSNIGGRKSL